MEHRAPRSDNYIDSFGDYVGGAELYVTSVGAPLVGARQIQCNTFFWGTHKGCPYSQPLTNNSMFEKQTARTLSRSGCGGAQRPESA